MFLLLLVAKISLLLRSLMLKKIKLFIFNIASPILEAIVLPIVVLFVLISAFKKPKSVNSIFMGMMHINNWTYVATALRQHGYTVQVVPWMIPPHEVDVIPYDIQLQKKFPILYSNFIGQYILQFWIFLWAALNFDVFITPFRMRILDRTIWLKNLEIPLLHLANKKVILNTYGGDVATPRLRRRVDLGYSLYDGYINDPQYKVFDEKAIAKNTRLLEKQADCIISAIDHVDYLDRVDYFFHLRCIDTEKIKPDYKLQNSIPVFVHAPNHRIIKGTDKIIEVIDALNKKGYSCKLKIVENTSNKKLLEIIKESDAVIDQILLGSYARLSIEAMALGKPVFCYLREDLFKFNPIWEHCPIINVNPDTLEQHLKKFLQKVFAERQIIGKLSRKYVEEFHSLEAIGRKCSQIIQEVTSK